MSHRYYHITLCCFKLYFLPASSLLLLHLHFFEVLGGPGKAVHS